MTEVENIQRQKELSMLGKVIVERQHFKEFYLGPYTLRLRHIPLQTLGGLREPEWNSIDILQVKVVPDPRNIPIEGQAVTDPIPERFEDICAFVSTGVNRETFQKITEEAKTGAYGPEEFWKTWTPHQRLWVSFIQQDCVNFLHPYSAPRQRGILFRYRTVRFENSQNVLTVVEDGGRLRRVDEYPADWWISMTDVDRDRVRHNRDVGWHFRRPNGVRFPTTTTRDMLYQWSWLLNPIEFDPDHDTIVIAPLIIDGMPVGSKTIGSPPIGEEIDRPIVIRVFGEASHAQRHAQYKMRFSWSTETRTYTCSIQIIPTWINFWHRKRVTPTLTLEKLYVPLTMSTVDLTASYLVRETADEVVVKFLPREVIECNMFIWNSIKMIFRASDPREVFVWGPEDPETTREFRNMRIDNTQNPPRLVRASFSERRLTIMTYINFDPSVSRRVPSLKRLAGLAVQKIIVQKTPGVFDWAFFDQLRIFFRSSPLIMPLVLESRIKEENITNKSKVCCSFSCNKAIDLKQKHYRLKSHHSTVFCSKGCYSEMN